MHATPHPDRASSRRLPPARRRVVATEAADRGPPSPVASAGDGSAVAGVATAEAGDVVARRYFLLGRIASRRTGAVWLAHDRLLSRPVVLKQLTSPERDALRAAVTEARAAAAVSNRHVVAVHDVVAADEGAWIVMEALDGESLASSIARTGGLGLPQVVTVAHALVDALAALHGAGVVHRDVKPGNVQLCGNGRVVLLDLGVAAGQELAGPGTPHIVAGTIEYLAPEVVLSGRSSPASDLYALGATLFCAVEGAVPFRLTCVQDLVDHAADPPDPPPAHRAGPLTPMLSALLQPVADRRWGVEHVRQHLALLDG